MNKTAYLNLMTRGLCKYAADRDKMLRSDRAKARSRALGTAGVILSGTAIAPAAVGAAESFMRSREIRIADLARVIDELKAGGLDEKAVQAGLDNYKRIQFPNPLRSDFKAAFKGIGNEYKRVGSGLKNKLMSFAKKLI